MNQNASWREEYDEEYYEQESDNVFFTRQTLKRQKEMKRANSLGKQDQKRQKKKRYTF